MYCAHFCRRAIIVLITLAGCNRSVVAVDATPVQLALGPGERNGVWLLPPMEGGRESSLMIRGDKVYLSIAGNLYLFDRGTGGMQLIAHRGDGKYMFDISGAAEKQPAMVALSYLSNKQDEKGECRYVRWEFTNGLTAISHEAPAGMSLNSGKNDGVMDIIKKEIFPAQVLFHESACLDEDNNGMGEYGDLWELTGLSPVGRIEAGKLGFLDGALKKSGKMEAFGYRFRIFLPDGHGGVLDDGAVGRPRSSPIGGAKEREKYWIVYAWPLTTEAGEKVYCMGHDGILRSDKYNDESFQWSSALEGGVFCGRYKWPPVRIEADKGATPP